jgi:hypothetical protein
MSTLELLQQRVERLEAHNRRLRQVAMALALSAAALLLAATSVLSRARVIEAQGFVVKDAAGRTRAALSLLQDQPGLTLFDDRGRQHVVLRSHADRSTSLQFHQRGQLRMALDSSCDGATQVQMFDKHRQLAAGFYSWPDGASGVALNRGQGGAHLQLGRDGTTRLSFSDFAGRPRGGWVLSAEGYMRPFDSASRAVDDDSSPSRSGGGRNELQAPTSFLGPVFGSTSALAP